jgi:hypothetical protein
LGRWRWVVERTFAWLNQFLRLRVRYDKRADIHEAFLSLGCALICWQSLKGAHSKGSFTANLNSANFGTVKAGFFIAPAVEVGVALGYEYHFLVSFTAGAGAGLWSEEPAGLWAGPGSGNPRL